MRTTATHIWKIHNDNSFGKAKKFSHNPGPTKKVLDQKSSENSSKTFKKHVSAEYKCYVAKNHFSYDVTEILVAKNLARLITKMYRHILEDEP